jgi:dihydroorotase-like cyclic amidohydrolase
MKTKMKSITLILSILLLCPALIIGQEPEMEVIPVVISNVTLIDGNGGEPISNVSIFIVADSIVDIGDDERDIPIESRIYDFSGHYVIPGLIDCHAHVSFDASTLSNREFAKARLKHALYGGITTVGDMTGDGRMSISKNKGLDILV